MVWVNHEKMGPMPVGRVPELEFVADLETCFLVVSECGQICEKVFPLRQHRIIEPIFFVNAYERGEAPAQICKVVIGIGSYFSKLTLSIFRRCSGGE